MLSATARRLSQRAAAGLRNPTGSTRSALLAETPPFQSSRPLLHNTRWLASSSGGGGNDDDDEKTSLEDLMRSLSRDEAEPSRDQTTPPPRSAATPPSKGDDAGPSSTSGGGGGDSLESIIAAYERSERPRGGGAKKATKFRRERDETEEEDIMRSLRKRKPSKLHQQQGSKSAFEEAMDDPLLELLDLDDKNEPMDQEYKLAAVSKEEQAKQTTERNEAMDQKRGRGWTDPWNIDEMYNSNITFDDLPDWSPKFVSTVSAERVQIHGPDKIPTLDVLAHLPLPPPPHPHPGHGHPKAYALHRNREHYNMIYKKVEALAAPRIKAIQTLPSWEDKQDAVDELFERIEFTLQEQETILGKHPRFGLWVERALENYLKSTQKQEEKTGAADTKTEAKPETEDEEKSETDADAVEVKEEAAASSFPTKEQDMQATPIFMDCFDGEEDDDSDNKIPDILKPMSLLARGANQGRMVEEWGLAAHKTTKRILLRQSTRAVAQFMQSKESSRVLVTGRQGTGKTAALLTLVASARKSGHIVLFMPHTSMLAEHGFYIEPSLHRPGMFDLPVLSEQICGELLECHKDDLAAIPVAQEIMEEFFSADQLSRSFESLDGMNVADLLKMGTEKRALAPMCYSAAIDALMKQDVKPFTMVIDEFNSLFHDGKYFHEDYDPEVRKSIPYNQINLFQPIVDAMGLVASINEPLPEPVLMKKGSMIAAMSLSKPVSVAVNEALVASANELADAAADSNMLVSNVSRLSNLEVDHIMANYETIGFGKLRMDQGETVTNDKEVAYLRAISSNVPQELMNACVM